MKNKIKVLYFYPELLNLYGDRGNIEVFLKRCEGRGLEVDLKKVNLGEKLLLKDFKEADFIFMGGGSDLNQKTLYEDLLKNKKGFLIDYIASEKSGLFICGAYQLLGNYYQTEDGKKIDGLGICNFYTKNEGKENRSVGKIKIELSHSFKNFFPSSEDNYLYGFENHGGQTYFEEELSTLGKVIYGFGNNRKEKKEGLVFNGVIGTYLHGPVFSLNPLFCDYFIKKSFDTLELPKLKNIDDSISSKARFYLK
jgi:CobQ-like glutamine amidotransferase family enzyme